MNKIVKGLLLSCLFTCQVLASELSITLPRTIAQDQNGFIWIGTQTKALRYDGHHSVPVVHDLGYINRITPLKDKTLIAASSGVVSLDAQLNETLLFSAEIENEVLDIAVIDNDLFILQQKQLIRFNVANNTTEILFSFKQQRKSSISQLNGVVCFTEQLKLHCFDSINDVKTTLLLPNKVNSLFTLDDNFILTTRNAIYRTYAHNTSLSKISRFSDIRINESAAAQREQHIWLTDNNDLYLYDLQEKKIVNHKYKRESNTPVFNLFESVDGTLWVAGATLEKLNPMPVDSVNIGNLNETSGMAWLIYGIPQPIIADVSGVFILKNYLNQNENSATPLENINKITKGHIYSAFNDLEYVYLGGYYGFFKAEPNSDEITNLSHLINNKPVQCIKEINENTLAICVANVGVYLFDKDKQSVKLLESTTAINSIVDFLSVDKDPENAWLATDQGLYHLKNNVLTRYLKNSHVIRLEMNQRNELFAATIDDGLFKLAHIDQTLSVSMIKFNNIGKRVNDIKIIGLADEEEGIAFTTGLGFGFYNFENNKIQTSAIGYSVGRITTNCYDACAITAYGELLRWGSDTTPENKGNTLKLSGFLVNGKRQAITERVQSNSFVELFVSTNNYKNTTLQEYSIKVNNNAVRKYSSANHVSFLPAWGDNTVIIKARYGESIITKSYHFTVEYPWYAGWIARAVYLCFLLFVIRFVIIWFSSNKISFMAQQLNFFSELVKVTKDKEKNNAELSNEYQQRLGHISAELSRSNAKTVTALYDKAQKNVKKEYLPIISELNNIEMLLNLQHYSKVKKAIADLVFQTQFQACVAAPDIYITGNLISAINQLIAKKKSELVFTNIHFEYEGFHCSLFDADLLHYCYKSIYELVQYVTEEMKSTDVVLSLEHKNSEIVFRITVDNVYIAVKDFNQKNLSLYEVRLITEYLQGTLNAQAYKEIGTTIIMTVPASLPSFTNISKSPKAVN